MMVCYAEQDNQMKPAEGKSGSYSRPFCIATSVGSFIGDNKMYIHGEADTRLHIIWMHMRGRCQKKNHTGYKNYGMRGISVCKEWEGYVRFRDWALGNGYNKDLTIDRIDNNGNYCPQNCKWSSMQTQSNNKRNSKFLQIAGQKKTLRQWCNEYLADYEIAKTRIKSGWTLIDALTIPKQKPWARKRLRLTTDTPELLKPK